MQTPQRPPSPAQDSPAPDAPLTPDAQPPQGDPAEPLPPADFDELYDAVVHDKDGDRVGTVGQIYLDDATEEPTFITVRTGLFGTKESFVPAQGAELTEDGELHVPYDKDMIKDCPTIDPEGHLDADEQSALLAHYGIAGEADAD